MVVPDTRPRLCKPVSSWLVPLKEVLLRLKLVSQPVGVLFHKLSRKTEMLETLLLMMRIAPCVLGKVHENSCKVLTSCIIGEGQKGVKPLIYGHKAWTLSHLITWRSCRICPVQLVKTVLIRSSCSSGR